MSSRLAKLIATPRHKNAPFPAAGASAQTARGARADPPRDGPLVRFPLPITLPPVKPFALYLKTHTLNPKS